MIRIVHIADIHIGADTVGPMNAEHGIADRVLDFFDSLDAVIEYSEEHDADLAIIAGDSFHKHPNPIYLSMFAERLSRLANKCPVILLIGNHDISGSVERASYVDVFGSINIPNVILASKYSVYRLKIKDETLCVATMPYPDKRRLLSAQERRGRSFEQIRALYKGKISKIIHVLEKKVQDPAILVGHFSVSGCIREVEMGEDSEVDLEALANPIWKYVALGHIHKYQNLTAGIEGLPPVVYSGSIERVSFGEEKEPKGFVWIELDDEVKFEFVETDAREYKTIHIEIPDGYEKSYSQYVISKLRKHDLTGKIVRLFIDMEERRTLRMTDIYDALSNAYAITAVSIKDRENRFTPRLEVDGPISAIPHRQLLEMYLEDTGLAGKKLKSLMSIADDIMSEVEDV